MNFFAFAHHQTSRELTTAAGAGTKPRLRAYPALAAQLE